MPAAVYNRTTVGPPAPPATAPRPPHPSELPIPFRKAGAPCGAQAPGLDPWLCTLDLGHAGLHAAHGLSDRLPLAVWHEGPDQ